MILRLKYEMVPKNAPLFAEDMVQAVKEIDGRDLDYTPTSLRILDDVLEGFRADGTRIDQIRETLFGLGCYLGEVFVRNAGGAWRLIEETPLADIGSLPLVVELPNGSVVNPLGKVLKRVEMGPGEDVSYFYDVFAAEAEGT